jgi:preprotein translocase subunit SecE
MATYNPLQFIQEVRQEVSKVTWPSRKEVMITTIAVVVMVTVASIFFMLADQVMAFLVRSILTLTSQG